MRLLLVSAIVLGGCGGFGPAGDRSTDPLDPSAELLAVDSISRSDDHHVVILEFTGSAPYVEADPCTAQYEGWARQTDGVLEVAVVLVIGALEHGSLPSGVACEAVGYLREVQVELDQPFDGNVVRDLAGFTRFLSSPDGLVELTGLPVDWTLSKEHDLTESPTGRWMRIYSPVASPGRDDPMVELVQSFHSPVGVTGGEQQESVRVGNSDGVLYRHAPTGELVLVWRHGSDGLALATNERDFSTPELIQLAESIE